MTKHRHIEFRQTGVCSFLPALPSACAPTLALVVAAVARVARAPASVAGVEGVSVVLPAASVVLPAAAVPFADAAPFGADAVLPLLSVAAGVAAPAVPAALLLPLLHFLLRVRDRQTLIEVQAWEMQTY